MRLPVPKIQEQRNWGVSGNTSDGHVEIRVRLTTQAPAMRRRQPDYSKTAVAAASSGLVRKEVAAKTMQGVEWKKVVVRMTMAELHWKKVAARKMKGEAA